MNFKRIGRILVCLILVCSLIIGISPIKAHATAVALAPVAVPVAAPLVIGAILIGLGVSYGVSSGAFDDLIDSCAAVLSDLGDIVNDKINLYVYNNRSYVDPSIIRNVRGHLFSNKVLTETYDKTNHLTAGSTFKDKDGVECIVNSDCHAFLYQQGNMSSRYVILIPFDFKSTSSLVTGGSRISTQDVSIDGTRCYFVTVSSENSYCYHLPLNTIKNNGYATDAVKSYFAGEFEFSPETVVTTEQDLALSTVIPSTIPFDEGYSTWGNLALQVDTSQGAPDDGNDDGEDLPAIIYPIQIPESQLDFSNVTQDSVWEGGEMNVPGAGTGTGSGTISGTISLPGWVQDGINNLLQGLRDLLSGVLSLPAAIASAIWSTLPAWMQEGITNLSDGLSDILKTLISIPELIVQGIAKVLEDVLTWAFAISDTFIATKVDALTLKYPYLDTFLALGVDLKTFLLGLGTTPPVIYINLGATNGSYNIGGQEVFMDLSWYAAYKPTMDAILGGFIWLWLAWRIYLSIPGIISGASGVWGAFSRHGERSMRAGNKGGTE